MTRAAGKFDKFMEWRRGLLRKTELHITPIDDFAKGPSYLIGYLGRFHFWFRPWKPFGLRIYWMSDLDLFESWLGEGLAVKGIFIGWRKK